MNKFRFTINAIAIAIFTLAFVSIAQGQATRTWVSGVGDDANPCSRTAPCKTFAGAISKTAVDGEIDCLDPGGFGAVTITKSVSIDGSPTGVGGILNASVTGIIINITAETAPHNLHTVILRGLDINGAGLGTRGIAISTTNVAGLKVIVENCFITGQNSSPGRGIEDFRTAGGTLAVINTTISNTLAAAVVVNTGATQVNVSISNSRVLGCGQGLNFGDNSKTVIYNTVVTGTPSAGIFGTNSGAGTTEISVDHCVVNGNSIGFNASTNNVSIRVSNTTGLANTTLFAQAGGGTVLSYGNNQFSGSTLSGPVSPG
jgi:hypothetical protein